MDDIKFNVSKIKREKAHSIDLVVSEENKKPTKLLKKDLELLDAEIAELDKELAKATEKLNIV